MSNRLMPTVSVMSNRTEKKPQYGLLTQNSLEPPLASEALIDNEIRKSGNVFRIF